MTRVIAVASGKGGVGKTTVTANLGIALSLLKEDVVILDMDINMANLELILGLEGKPVTLQDVLAGHENIQNAIYEGPGGVHLIPTGLSLPNLNYIKRERIEDVFEQLIGNVDLILIDSPAGLERDALAAMSPADEMILVTTPEVTSITDTLKTKLLAERMGINISGVVLNRDKKDRDFLSVEEVEAIMEVPILSIIPEDQGLIKFYAEGTPVLIEEPESAISRSFLELAAYLVDKEYLMPKIPKKSFISKFIDGLMGNGPLKTRQQ
ncbi:MAG TPA: cell division ATPase MinD [Methanobacterium sp.]|jgi:septum site-determining protein MinD|nr:MAG: septum site-determining protein MinD [Methanobacterium sp.]HOI39840.1 cell division ATPase MinD [Methanobacterium sp.]HOI70982.1 cell division ATPase MinD [Methanobacterium sp.]